MISLYFHIPFCTKKCPYCHFYVLPNRSRDHALLYEGLCLEWEKNLPFLEGKKIVSIYFGGGTPTLWGPSYIKAILEKTEKYQDSQCEITIEANPEDLTLPLLSAYLETGINRLSMGVQSLDDRSLETLERTHSAKKAIEALHHAEKAGFQNVSIDLMYDLPGQTESSWETTLNQLSSLPFHHLSLYNLTIEPHTPFYKRELPLPPASQSLKFLTRALDTFSKIGLKRYEISAFCKNGLESRHNKGYWTGRPFLGFGPSAFSYWENERYKNQSNLLRYHRDLKSGISPVDFREKLPDAAREKERLAIRLRLMEGAPISPHLPIETREAIDRLIELRLLKREENQLFLSERGTLLYDTVASELI